LDLQENLRVDFLNPAIPVKAGIQIAYISHILDLHYRIKYGTGSAGKTLFPAILA